MLPAMLVSIMRKAKIIGPAFLLLAILFASEARAQPSYIDYVESESYPIRVHYATVDQHDDALEFLAHVESAWAAEVVGMGFPPPVTQDATGNIIEGAWIYLDSQAEGNYFMPVGDNPETPWTDCTGWIIVNPGSVGLAAELLVAHEFNHALEFAADCIESNFSYENTTVAVTTLLFPEDYLFYTYFLPVFQQNPNFGLDCVFWSDQNRYYYHYGASLFQVFLEEHYGDADGKLLSAIWEAAKQNGTVTTVDPFITADVPNRPHLFDAIETVLAGHGATLLEAFRIFSQWRYFLGSNDDGMHFAYGDVWGGCEVAANKSHGVSELPIEQALPDPSPSEMGAAYLELDLTGLDPNLGIRFNFQGSPATRWSLDALLVNADRTADVESMTLDESMTGELQLAEVADYAKIVFVAVNLGVEDHSPESPDCHNGDDFYYSIHAEDLKSAPVITSISPDVVTIGGNAYLWVSGSGFSADLTASFSVSEIQINSFDFVDETSIGLDVTVQDSASPGTASFTLTNTYGRSATLPDAVTLVEPAGPDAGTSNSSGSDNGCGCRVPSGSGRKRLPPLGAILVLGLMLLAFARRRRRR